MQFEAFINKVELLKNIDCADGSGIKIAVVDSGIDASHPFLEGCVTESYETVQSSGRTVLKPCRYYDNIGHGTMCAGVIHEIAPRAEIINLKIFSGYKSSPSSVTAAINWCVDNNIDVVNLSLCTRKMSSSAQNEMEAAVERAHYENVLLIAATDNHIRSGYPADFSSVVGVDFEHKENFMSFNYFPGRKYEIDAKGIYVDVIKPGNKRETVSCSSIATPHITGLAAKIRQVIPGLNSHMLKSILMSLRENEQSV